MPYRQDGSATLWSLRMLMQGVEVPEKHIPGLRAQQMNSMSRITNVIILSNVLNIIAILAIFLNYGQTHFLYAWSVCGLIINIGAWFKYRSFLRINPQRRSNRRAIADFTRVAICNGLLWGLAPIVVLGTADVQGHMVMGIISAGMMFAGGFLLSRIPIAAIYYIVPSGLGLATALMLQTGPKYSILSILMVYYLMVLLVAVAWTHRQFVEQYLGRAAIQEQSELIGLLLRDFEESTSDSLWQTDEAGVLQELPIVAEATDSLWSANEVLRRGAPLTSIFHPGEARDALQAALEGQVPFRDQVVPIKDGNGEMHWWSVTGKPVIERGQFFGFRGVASDVTQSKKIEDRIAHMAHYDGLTGLPNRITMQERLESLLRRQPPPPACRALLMMDLDSFKWVNDTLGHPAGDELLRQVAARIRALSEPGDFVARLGGDEFAMVVERRNVHDLHGFLDQFASEMSELYDVWGSTANSSASIGVRLFDPAIHDSRTMFRQADLALYQAKHLGKAKWCMFDDELEQRAQARLDIQEELQRAIDRNELRIHFQPIVDATTHKTVACETLLRWQHPERGLVYPGEFIEHAEENGLITRMGEWVIRAALAEATRLPEHVRICVNISPLQVHSASLASTIVNAIAASNMDPSRLELEITETALMSNTEFTLRRLHQLRSLGVRIALDDFGTGFSSLNHLRSFPFDRIKIDRTFVSDIETRADSQAITKSMVSLARSLGMQCTAEGVETSLQAEYLSKLGCEELQGYFFSHAHPLEQLGHLVQLQKASVAPPLQILEAGAQSRAS
ncbi:putative sensory box-containing diguanylate cyclase [Hyphomonas neptunium ATCC 15444]|uniref:Putative sensory box-containing diguanylate cyclase n=2 Tax=Hyphomonas TaxID=85 RepID=Q0C2A3_HYPNA|nr:MULTISPECIES: EAL domain-containing protein [Hyphomonas]ABI78833.1 putative sensory box-containing diguanylate cyclase [Hyphomonas neptunium ATCC 15444]KCZ93146.1 putative sensory box-containing diguanylate cyclase [Hyphomonas hirschiana VP5]